MLEDPLKTLNNLAMAHLKLQAYEPALNAVESVLKWEPNNVKALFRKGKVNSYSFYNLFVCKIANCFLIAFEQILGEKGETEKALSALVQGQIISSEDKMIYDVRSQQHFRSSIKLNSLRLSTGNQKAFQSS